LAQRNHSELSHMASAVDDSTINIVVVIIIIIIINETGVHRSVVNSFVFLSFGGMSTTPNPNANFTIVHDETVLTQHQQFHITTSSSVEISSFNAL